MHQSREARAGRTKPTRVRRAAKAGLVGAVVTALAGCAGGGPLVPGLETASLSGGTGASGAGWAAMTSAAPAGSQPAVTRPPRETLADLVRRNSENPTDAAVALRYARHLKAAGKPQEAFDVLEKAAAGGAGQQAFTVEHGLIALQIGNARRAEQLLSAAQPATTKDWRVPSGLGVALASLGRQGEAQKHFARALELSPGNPIVLNNLAMSHILERRIDKAEPLLRTAAGTGTKRPHVAQNLTLASVLRGDLPGGGEPPIPAAARAQRSAAVEAPLPAAASQ